MILVRTSNLSACGVYFCYFRLTLCGGEESYDKTFLKAKIELIKIYQLSLTLVCLAVLHLGEIAKTYTIPTYGGSVHTLLLNF